MHINTSKSINLKHIFFQSLGVAFLGAVLGSLLIGFKLQSRGISLELDWRLSQVLAVAFFVFLGRFCLGLQQIKLGLLSIFVTMAVCAYMITAILLSVQTPESSEAGNHLLLPYSDMKLNWMTIVIYLGLFLYLIYLFFKKRMVLNNGIQSKKWKFGLNKNIQTILMIAFLLLLISAPFLQIIDRRILNILTQILLYIVLGWGLSIVVGLAGLLDLGYVAFYAVGAYAYALLSLHFDFGFWLSLPLAGLLAAALGIILGFPVLRLRGDYLAIVTLGFGEIIRMVLVNWYEFTGGPNGINQIPKPTLFGYLFDEPNGNGNTVSEWLGIEYSNETFYIFMYLLVLSMAFGVFWFIRKLRRLPIGRAWEAIREDEIACRALGLNPTNIKLTAFATGAMIAGFAGAFFAAYQGFISPESFTFVESITILAIVVLGGMGNLFGIALAAILLIFMLEFRDLEMFRMLALGVLQVFVMIWRPHGLISHRSPTVYRHMSTKGVS